MSKLVKVLDQAMDSITKKAIYKYYQFRIKTQQDPYKIRFRKNPYKVLVILSHMRSGSSLLSHLLFSNPEIIGFGETHINYTSEAQVKDLIFTVYWQLKNLKMSHQYVLDKILHNNKILNYDWLTSPQVYSIFLLRSPENTLQSILALKPHLTEQEALDHYCYRLLELQKYAQLINSKQRTLLITYEQVLQQTPLVFDALQKFLGTQQGFSENYKVLETTGKKGVGDSSGNIKSGRIIQETRKKEYNLSPDSIIKANHSFDQCYQILSEFCQTVET